jgi:hypothetical protein
MADINGVELPMVNQVRQFLQKNGFNVNDTPGGLYATIEGKSNISLDILVFDFSSKGYIELSSQMRYVFLNISLFNCYRIASLDELKFLLSHNTHVEGYFTLDYE